MKAFYNDPKIQKKYIDRVRAHQKADEIIQGKYWENGKGCAVGCIVEKPVNAHQALEKELQIPQMLGHLADRIFEGLTVEEAKKFPLRFIKAISLGSDLSKVGYKFQVWLLVDKHNGIIQWANEETKKIIIEIAELHKALADGKKIDCSAAESAAESAWSAAESAAGSAAESAESAGSAAESAGSAAKSAAGSAAESAAGSAARSAARSAGSATWSAAWSAAWSAHCMKMADKLIQLLKEAK